MNRNAIEKLLHDLYGHKIGPEKAAEQLAILPYENIDFARVDHHRSLRSGLPEVIYGKGKTADQLDGIIKTLYKAENDILVTKLDPKVRKKTKAPAFRSQVQQNCSGSCHPKI